MIKMITVSDLRLRNMYIIGLQESNYKYYVTRKLTDEQFFEFLEMGFIGLKWVVRQQGLADIVKNEIKRFGKYPDWWAWYFGWKEDYDITEYDTGDPIELAIKVFLASKKNIKFNKVSHLYSIGNVWAISEDNELVDDEEYIKKLAKYIAILSWSDYELPDFDNMKEYVKELASKVDSSDIQFQVFGNKTVLDNVRYLYDRPYAWIPWRDVVRG